jgi:phospholipase D1/2
VRNVFRVDTADWQTPLLVVGVFLLGSTLMVPVTLMIVAAAATLGLAAGLIYAALGTLVSAAALYGVGSWLGTGLVQRLTGGRLSKIRNIIRRRGVLAVAAVRVLPIAPFSLVNLAAGAVSVGLWRFLAGTVLGMAPGFLLLSALGDQLYRLLTEPSLAALAVVSGLILLWGAAVLVIRRWARREARQT